MEYVTGNLVYVHLQVEISLLAWKYEDFWEEMRNHWQSLLNSKTFVRLF